jgi:hypothetical protein
MLVAMAIAYAPLGADSLNLAARMSLFEGE